MIVHYTLLVIILWETHSLRAYFSLLWRSSYHFTLEMWGWWWSWWCTGTMVPGTLFHFFFSLTWSCFGARKMQPSKHRPLWSFFKMENCIIVETQVMMMIRLVVKVRICLHLFVNVIVSLFKLPSEKKVMHDFHVWCVWVSLSRPFGGQVKWMSKGKSREKRKEKIFQKNVTSCPFPFYTTSKASWLVVGLGSLFFSFCRTRFVA